MSLLAQTSNSVSPFFVFAAITAGLGLAVCFLLRTRLINFVLPLFSLSLCLTGLEGYYRFFYASSDGLGQLSKNFSDRYYHFDAYGLRASNLPVSETNDNIVVVGDSHVFGAGLKAPSERFSEKLATHYPKLHVINLGLPGWDTKTETAQLTKHLGETRAKIPLIVLTYFFNDIEEDVTTADRERVLPPSPPVKPTRLDHLLQWFSGYSRFVEVFYYRIGYPRLVRDRLGQIQRFYHDPEIMERHLASLEQFRDVAEKQYSARLLIVILPFLHTEELLHKDELYEHFRHVLNERGFNYIDMQPVFTRYRTRQLWVNKFDPHTDPLANDLIANAIVSYLDAHPENLGGRSAP